MTEKNLKKLNKIRFVLLIILIIFLCLLYWFFTRTFLVVEAFPANSKVFIDGRSYQTTKSGKIRKIISPGEHSIKIEADDYISKLDNYQLKRARINRLNISLKEIPEPELISKKGTKLALGKNYDEIFFLGDNDKTLYGSKLSLDDSGKIKTETFPITNPNLKGIQDIIWSKDKNLALFKKNDGIYLFDFKKYDFVNQTETLWGKNIGDAAWAPDDSKIAYYNKPDKTLIFSDATNKKQTRVANLADIGITDPILKWSSDSEWLLLIPRNDYQNKIYLFHAYSRTFKPITEKGSYLDAAFSPNNEKIIYTKNNDEDTTYLINRDGSEQQTLGLKLDLNKIWWKSDSKDIYAIVFNPSQNKDTLIQFDTEKNQQNGIQINDLGGDNVNSLLTINNDKILVYQTNSGIYALNLSAD